MIRKPLFLLLAAVAAAAITLPAAAGTAKAHTHWFAGAVSSVGSGTLTVDVLWTGPHDGSLDGTDTTVAVDGNTQLTYGKDKTPITLESLQPGDLVGVVASGSDLTSLAAVKVHAYCNCHWVGGTIGALGSGSITVQVTHTGPYDTALAGQSVTIGTAASTSYLRGKDKTPLQFSDLKVGDRVGIVFAANGFFRAPGFDWTKASFTAKVVHDWVHGKAPAGDALAAPVAS